MRRVSIVLLTVLIAVAVLGGTVVAFWNGGRTSHTAFDPVMP